MLKKSLAIGILLCFLATLPVMAAKKSPFPKGPP